MKKTLRDTIQILSEAGRLASSEGDTISKEEDREINILRLLGQEALMEDEDKKAIEIGRTLKKRIREIFGR